MDNGLSTGSGQSAAAVKDAGATTAASLTGYRKKDEPRTGAASAKKQVSDQELLLIYENGQDQLNQRFGPTVIRVLANGQVGLVLARKIAYCQQCQHLRATTDMTEYGMCVYCGDSEPPQAEAA